MYLSFPPVHKKSIQTVIQGRIEPNVRIGYHGLWRFCRWERDSIGPYGQSFGQVRSQRIYRWLRVMLYLLVHHARLSNGALPKTAVTAAPHVVKLVLELNELAAVPKEVLFFTSLQELCLGQNKLVLRFPPTPPPLLLPLPLLP
jgi:hypothetical protein